MHLASPFFFHRRLARVIGLVIALLAMAGRHAAAHQVPSLTVEALFSADRSYILRISLDPRLFLSDQPASLPPVPIEWYREQSEAELTATKQKAAEYLKRALTLKFGDKSSPVENCEYQPMDGATNMPLADDTKEVHLLATMKGIAPDNSTGFAIALSQSANVSMILMNSFEGTMERRPNVIFPGETTRPYALAFASPTNSAPKTDSPAKVSADATLAKQAEATVSDRVQAEPKSKWGLMAMVIIALVAVLLLAAFRTWARHSTR